MEKNIAVIIPCYNERNTITRVIEKLKKHLPEAKIFVYDNYSPDDTILKAKEANKVVYVEKHGKGHVLKQAFDEVDADYYVVVDGDDTYDISGISRYLSEVIEKDIDLANFKRVATHFQSFEFGRFYINGFYNKLFNRFFPSQCTDVLSGYKILSNKLVKSLNIQTTGFEVDTEILMHAVIEKSKIQEYICRYFPRHKKAHSKFRLIQDYFNLFKFLLTSIF